MKTIVFLNQYTFAEPGIIKLTYKTGFLPKKFAALLSIG